MRHFIYDHKKHPMNSFATKKKDSHRVKGLINKDLCIFICGEELRICSNIVQGFKSESADVGCYALPIKEIKYETTVFNEISALRVSDGDFYVTLGKRAEKIIEKAKEQL